MTEKDLKKLSRVELLEILVEQGKQLEKLQHDLDEANAKLADKELRMKKAGSIAEASLQLNGVFEAAQNAADQYVENIKRLYMKEQVIYKKMLEKSKQD